MSQRWVAHDEEGAFYPDHLAIQNYAQGEVAGAKRVVALLRRRAGEAFGSKRDADALMLRLLADDAETCVAELEAEAAQRARSFPLRPADGDS